MNVLRTLSQTLLLASVISSSLMVSNQPGHSQVDPSQPNESISPAEASPDRFFDGLIPNQIVFNAPPPPNQGTPGGRAQGGASRGPCRDYEELTALVPTTDGIVWGRTTEVNPSIWFYLPEPLTDETLVEFIVQDAADNYIYDANLTVPNTPAGLIQFDIEPEDNRLRPDQLYTWTLIVYCDPAQPTEFVFVKGTLQYMTTDADLQAQLAIANPLEQAKLYAANGIWHDALSILAEQYQAHPSNAELSQAWDNLLQQVSLDPLAIQPFSTCCTD